jgi:hypothetical protein
MKRTSKITLQVTVAMAISAALFSVTPKMRAVSAAQQEASPKSAEQEKPNADARPSQGQVAIPTRLPRGKKLIMTDGSFQLAREYSVNGDRVRYWSVERSDWEEIPSSLIDWDATRKAEADQVQQDADLKEKIHATEIVERTKDIDVDRSLEIKPGIFLPDAVGLYALEDKLVLVMKQSETVSRRAKSREVEKILTGVPLIPSKETLEIPGEHATIRVSSAEPEFFMRPVDDREPRFRLLRAQLKAGHRELDSTSTYMSGEQTHHAQDIDFQTWTPAHGVFRYTISERLEPGEYAFVEMTNEGISAYVWDFGIDAPGKQTSK